MVNVTLSLWGGSGGAAGAAVAAAGAGVAAAGAGVAAAGAGVAVAGAGVGDGVFVHDANTVSNNIHDRTTEINFLMTYTSPFLDYVPKMITVHLY